MSDKTATNLADNIRQLRSVRGLTQQQLATAAEVPRPTVAHLESGGANPTLAVLLRVGAALQVTVEELIAPPRTATRLYKADELPTKQRGKVTVRQLLPDHIPSLVVERMALPGNARMTGVPHTPGTREYLTCESGRVVLWAGGQEFVVSAGDVLVFRGDQKHSYRNPDASPAVAYSVVALAPTLA